MEIIWKKTFLCIQKLRYIFYTQKVGKKETEMIQVKNLTAIHKKDSRPLFENLSFVLEKGDKMAVIGEEGNGKSTLLKLLYDPAITDTYIEYEGEILKNGACTGYLAQELAEEEKELTIWEYMSSDPVFFEKTPKELGKIAGTVGLPGDIYYGQEKLRQLSGGEKVKLQLARILMLDPEVILLDEPSNDLDLPTLEFLERFILNVPAAVLYVSHDETLIERTANKILHLEQLRRKTRCRYTVAKSTYEEYLRNRERMFASQERIAGKQREEFARQQERYLRIQQKVEHQQNAISRQDPHGGRLLKKKMHAVKAMGKRFEREKEEFLDFPETEDAVFLLFGKESAVPQGKQILEYCLDVLAAGEKVLARDLFLRVKGPERIGIIGKNGCGKTTFLRKIAEELRDRQDIRTVYMPQNYEEEMDMGKTCVEFLKTDGSTEEEKRIRTYLGSMKYTAQEMDHPAGELSGGQKAKLFFLKISMQRSQVLILDEPTRNFSPLTCPVIRKLLAEFPGTIISISHDRKYLKEVCNVLYELTEKGLKRLYNVK